MTMITRIDSNSSEDFLQYPNEKLSAKAMAFEKLPEEIIEQQVLRPYQRRLLILIESYNLQPQTHLHLWSY